MANSKATKKALFMSMLSLLLCFTMLMGATFAWFTDTVTSKNNRIVAGNLAVDLVMDKGDGNGYVSIADGTGDIFSEAAGNGINWEPGKTQIVYLGVKNNGSLALKYNVILNITDGNFDVTDAPGLIGSLEFAVLKDIKQGDLNVNNWEEVKNHVNCVVTKDLPEGQVVAVSEGILADIALTPYDPANEGETDYVAIAVHMKEEATNEYQNGAVTIDLTVNATQKDAELDSFDSTYDKDAEIPQKNSVTVSGNSTNSTTLKYGDVTVSIPVGSPAGNYSLDVTKKAVTTDTAGDTTAEYDISLYKDDQKVEGTIEFPVTIDIGKFHVIKSLKHNGVEITGYDYDAFTGIVTFKTTSFSPFEVVYEDVTVDEPEAENRQITAGTFTVNPEVFDPALAEEGSDYIAINYTVGDETRYVVNERATTVIVAPGTTDYEAKNGNYTVTTEQSGKLYSVISGLQNNAHSTVYLLPGTYNEATTINVYSSMDIIGLGDAEDVKVVKVKGSYSNRHLFNCNGAVTRDEHIQVTIRNMYLDASAKNLNSAGKFYSTDNAAVQSIRLSKVKCYDLIIVKSGFPFYVNGKYDARGAYMYVENCSTTSSSVVDTASTYKFYHNNLTYNNGTAYTNNSGSIQNTSMAPDDWEW